MSKYQEWLKQRKYCPRCEQTKLTSEFHLQVSRSGGFQCYCSKCHLSMSRKWKYEGFTKEHENMMSCEICSVDLVAGRKGGNTQHIDHDHETGIIRGVLCNNCNTMLGAAKDTPEILREAARYLEERTS